jgi:hypothetical protein
MSQQFCQVVLYAFNSIKIFLVAQAIHMPRKNLKNKEVFKMMYLPQYLEKVSNSLVSSF